MKADNDNHIVWKGVRIDGLPSSQSEAKSSGATYFYTGKPCHKGHVSPRYTGGGCIDCFYEKEKSVPWSDKPLTGNKTLAKITREAARYRGDTHYVPSRPCKHGHMLRWVSTNNCIQCDAELRNERRELARDKYLLKTYGINQAQRDTMASRQKWKCLVCDDNFKNDATMHVDHCHETGKIRGILCSRCNQAIGLLRDDPGFMRRAAEYVEQSRGDYDAAA